MFSTTTVKADLQVGLDQMGSAFEAFRQAYPAFDSTNKLDQLRATEYARLDRHGHVYLDYTGGALYAESQLREHIALLSDGIFGNPHSKNLTSMVMTQLVEQARQLSQVHAGLGGKDHHAAGRLDLFEQRRRERQLAQRKASCQGLLNVGRNGQVRDP